MIGLRLATVPDRHFGSQSRSELNRCTIAGLGFQWTRTIIMGKIRCETPNPSEMRGLSTGRPAGSSIDSYKTLVFAVCQWYLNTIVFATTNNRCLHAVQLALSINLECVFFLFYIVFLAIKAVNSSLMSSLICVKPCYPLCRTKYCWPSVDAQFHDGVTYESCNVSNEMAAMTSSMNYYHLATLRFAKMQVQ